MSSETKLRAMRHKDVWQVNDLEINALTKAGAPHLSLSMEELEFHLRQPYRRSIVAVDCHDRVRGWMLENAGTGQNYCEIRRIVVHGDWWRMGVGKQLLDSLMIQARDAEIELHTHIPFSLLPAAANFYKRFLFFGTMFKASADGQEDFATMKWTHEREKFVKAGAA